MEICGAFAHGCGHGAVRLSGSVRRNAGVGQRRGLHLERTGCRGADDAAGSVANGVPVDFDRARNQGRPRPDAHLAAGRAQPGALAGMRAAFGHRDHGDPLRHSATVSGDACLARFPRRNLGAGSRPDFGRHRRVFAAPGARLQTDVRLLHGRTHGHYFGGGRPRRIGRRLRRNATDRQPLRDQSHSASSPPGPH